MLRETPLHGPCDHCGAHVPIRHVHWVGSVDWSICVPCRGVIRRWDDDGERPAHPFGLPLSKLPRPSVSKAYWATYRLACERVGYTWATAAGREERDALYRLEMQLAREGLLLRGVPGKPKAGFIIADYIGELGDLYGTTALTADEVRYIRLVTGEGVSEYGTTVYHTSVVPPKRGTKV